MSSKKVIIHEDLITDEQFDIGDPITLRDGTIGTVASSSSDRAASIWVQCGENTYKFIERSKGVRVL